MLADKDECSEDPCFDKKNSVCKNTDGSFKCECIKGFRMSADESSCEGKKKNFNITFLHRLNAVSGGLKRETEKI